MSFIVPAGPSPLLSSCVRSYGWRRAVVQIIAAAACYVIGGIALAPAYAQAPVKIVALGDSLSAGYGLPDKEGFVPSLRNQNYKYLVGQLHKLAEGHRHNVDRNLVFLVGSLDDSDIAAVADYLSRQRGVVRAHDHMLSNGVVVN